MAIQHRRGIYDQFDPTRLVAGEWAVVLSDDPSASDGRAAYVCFGSGIVKRVAVYEDMVDWFLDLRESTVDDIVEESITSINSEYETIKAALIEAEQTRDAAESARRAAESIRAASENSRDAAESARRAAESEREEFAEDLEDKLANGDLNGATFTPHVNSNGAMTWTNDKGLANPASVNIKGEKGNDGVVTQLAAGLFALQVEGAYLMLTYADDTDAPDLSIGDDGCLYIEIGVQNDQG